MKHTVNAVVLAVTTDHAWYRLDAIVCSRVSRFLE
jgi:hypothetical protein